MDGMIAGVEQISTLSDLLYTIVGRRRDSPRAHSFSENADKSRTWISLIQQSEGRRRLARAIRVDKTTEGTNSEESRPKNQQSKSSVLIPFVDHPKSEVGPEQASVSQLAQQGTNASGGEPGSAEKPPPSLPNSNEDPFSSLRNMREQYIMQEEVDKALRRGIQEALGPTQSPPQVQRQPPHYVPQPHYSQGHPSPHYNNRVLIVPGVQPVLRGLDVHQNSTPALTYVAWILGTVIITAVIVVVSVVVYKNVKSGKKKKKKKNRWQLDLDDERLLRHPPPQLPPSSHIYGPPYHTHPISH